MRTKSHKLVGMLVAAMFMTVICIAPRPVFADDIFENTKLGAKIDIPNIIKLAENHSIGAEISITDITKDWDLGSQAFIKYTFTGSLFDFTK